MNWVTIIGIVLMAAGTFMTIYGPLRGSQKDKKEVIEKIDQTKREITSIVNSNSGSPNVAAKLEGLSNDFDKWAGNFDSVKAHRIEQLKNERDAKKYTEKSDRLKVSEPLYPMVKFFENQLKSAVNAYNSHSPDDKIVFNPAALPNDLFFDPANEYIVQLNFFKKYSLYCYLGSLFGDDACPSLFFQISDLDANRFKNAGWFVPGLIHNLANDILEFNSQSRKVSFSPGRGGGFVSQSKAVMSFNDFEPFASDLAKTYIEKCVVYFASINADTGKK